MLPQLSRSRWVARSLYLSSKVFLWACSLCLRFVNAVVRSRENPRVAVDAMALSK